MTSKSNGANECVGANTQVHVCECLLGRRSRSQNERNRRTGQYFSKTKRKKGNFLGDDWVVITVTLKLKLTLCCWHLLIHSLHYVNTKHLKTKQVQLKQQKQHI